MSKIKQLLTKVFLYFLNVDMLQAYLQNHAVRKSYSSIVVGTGTKISATAQIVNRREKEYITLGKDCLVDGEIHTFLKGGKVIFGNGVYLGTNSRIWSNNQVSIGDHVLISHGVNIIDTDSHEINHQERLISHTTWKQGVTSLGDNVISKPILIKDHAWISFNVTILKGVTIGEGAIIGANSVVTKDVPAYTVAVGNPAQVVKELER